MTFKGVVIMKQKNNQQQPSNKRFTGFEIMYSSAGSEKFADSTGYRRALEKVYEMQREKENDT